MFELVNNYSLLATFKKCKGENFTKREAYRYARQYALDFELLNMRRNTRTYSDPEIRYYMEFI
jgi:hypothetical protein